MADRPKKRKLAKALKITAILVCGLYIALFAVSLLLVNGYNELMYDIGAMANVYYVTIDLKTGEVCATERFRDQNGEWSSFVTRKTLGRGRLAGLKLKTALTLAPVWPTVDPMFMPWDYEWKFTFFGDDGRSKTVYCGGRNPLGEKFGNDIAKEVMEEHWKNISDENV